MNQAAEAGRRVLAEAANNEPLPDSPAAPDQDEWGDEEDGGPEVSGAAIAPKKDHAGLYTTITSLIDATSGLSVVHYPSRRVSERPSLEAREERGSEVRPGTCMPLPFWPNAHSSLGTYTHIHAHTRTYTQNHFLPLARHQAHLLPDPPQSHPNQAHMNFPGPLVSPRVPSP
jgi:hypothetical protein